MFLNLYICTSNKNWFHFNFAFKWNHFSMYLVLMFKFVSQLSPPLLLHMPIVIFMYHHHFLIFILPTFEIHSQSTLQLEEQQWLRFSHFLFAWMHKAEALNSSFVIYTPRYPLASFLDNQKACQGGNFERKGWGTEDETWKVRLV